MTVTADRGLAEIEIKMPKSTPTTKDLWIFEATQLMWEVWSRLGWQTTTSQYVKKEDWWRLMLKEDMIMARIERILKMSKKYNLTDIFKYEEALTSISELAKLIDDQDIMLMDCKEAKNFRTIVANVLLVGISRGLDVKSELHMDKFHDPIAKIFLKDAILVLQEKQFQFIESKEMLIGILTIETDSKLYIPTFTCNIDSV